MRLFQPLIASVALRLTFSGRSHRFATFVALLSALGIAIGVAALITVASVMQGLQGRLKNTVLGNVPHVVVRAPQAQLDELLQLPYVMAAAPFAEEQVLLQTPSQLGVIRLQGLDMDTVSLRQGHQLEQLSLPAIPAAGSYGLNADSPVFEKFALRLGQKVRLISTSNASYTPLGISPSQRLFTLTAYVPALRNAAVYNAVAHYEDVRRLLRQKGPAQSLRLWLSDPFKIDQVAAALKDRGLKFEDWRSSQGEFFRAVALERLTMSLMLCLIVVVAAFNILSALSMVVSSRLQEIAVLKTLGMSRADIQGLFMCSGLGLGAGGSMLGLILGIPLTLHADTLLNLIGVPTGQLPADLNWPTAAAVVGFALALSALCTAYPALKAAATDPARHLMQN
ncbi:MAG: ABC transporter permease [Succinivibrio sp.]|nr:ABC transporter permease [Succinivibrio sp.]